MCTTCGCGHGPETGHHHHHHHHGDGVIAFGTAEPRLIEIEENLLAENARHAQANRARLEASGLLALNLVSSPGAGKTTLLAETIRRLKGTCPVAAIEGDQQTDADARRIREAGAPAVQVNTGKGCHLDAHMVAHALDELPLDGPGVLFIENVGNLVCPAAFDLGEAERVVILSVTEGDDKPLKYPDMFRGSGVMLVTKTDLLPYVDFDVAACIANARKANPRIRALTLSARDGAGMADWLALIEGLRQVAGAGRAAARAEG